MRARSKVRAKRFDLTFDELAAYVDALFDPTEVPGWVNMIASPKGRGHINGLFPKAHIEWRKLDEHDFGGGWPADWHGFEINLPDVAAATETKLPFDIMNCTLDECNQSALAFLLAFAVHRDGGFAAFVNRSRRKLRVEIYGPKAN